MTTPARARQFVFALVPGNCLSITLRSLNIARWSPSSGAKADSPGPLMWANETLTVGWGLVGIIVKNALQALFQFLSEDPQFAGTMAMTWPPEPTSNGTLVAVVADDVPSGIRRAEHESGIPSTLASLANFVEWRPAA